MAPMRAFSILQKWPKMAKMTSDDLLTLKMVLTQPPINAKQNTFSCLKYIISVELEQKNDLNGNIANYSVV